MQLFREKGYGSTSVADLLKAADVNSGSLYNFFPGKRDVLVAVLEAYRSGMAETLLEPAWQGVNDPVDKIFTLLVRYRQLLVETDCLYGCPVGSLALEIHEPDPPVREPARRPIFSPGPRRCTRAWIEADCRLPDALDRLGLAEFVLTTMEGAVMQARTFRDVAYFDRAVRHLRIYFDFLLYGRPGLPSPVREALSAGA